MKCTETDPSIVAGEGPVPCPDEAVDKQGLCDRHLWTLRKKRVQERLALARGATTENEGRTVAVAAIDLFEKYELHFWPNSAMLDRATSVYQKAKADPEQRRTAALGLALASSSCELLTVAERAAKIAPPPRPPPPYQGATPHGRPSVPLGARAASFLKDLLGSIETRPGRTALDEREDLARTFDDIEREIKSFRQAFAEGDPEPAKKKPLKPKKPPKAPPVPRTKRSRPSKRASRR